MKILKVTLVYLIVLSNTLESSLKGQKHTPITEKPFLRKLQFKTKKPSTIPETTKGKCKGENYIIVKYSKDVSLPIPNPQTDDSNKDSKIKCISTNGSKIKSDTKASKFKFYLKNDVTSLENIFSKYEPSKILSLDFSHFKIKTLTNLKIWLKCFKVALNYNLWIYLKYLHHRLKICRRCLRNVAD